MFYVNDVYTCGDKNKKNIEILDTTHRVVLHRRPNGCRQTVVNGVNNWKKKKEREEREKKRMKKKRKLMLITSQRRCE